MPELKIVESGNELLTPEQTASYLQIKINTVYNWTMRKILPVCKMGRLNRYRRADLDAFIEKSMREALTQ